MTRRFVRTVLLALVLSAVARADSESMTRFLNAALRLYENLEYERALEQVQNARKTAVTPDEQATVNLYEGMVLFDLGRTEDAQGAFRAALLLDPNAQLPLKVSPKVKAGFEQMRNAVNRELAPLLAKQEEERRKKAEQERLGAEQRANDAAAREAAARATAPAVRDGGQPDRPVVTQLTPREPPPEPVVIAPGPQRRGFPVVAVVFCGAGAVTGGLGGFFGSQSKAAVTAARNEPFQQPASAHLARARDSATTANALFVSTGVLAAGALISGIVWYVSSTSTSTEPPP